MRRLLSVLLLAAAAPACTAGGEAPLAVQPSTARGTFQFNAWAGPELRIWYHVPSAVTDTTPVVFVMHGVGRDADRYRDEWSALAEANHFILVVPEFDKANFPGSVSYNHGGFVDREGRPRPKEQWTFAAIDPLFDAVTARTGTKVSRYAIYGHSAGAQFVHRFVQFMPEARYRVAVAANAGSYAVPDFGVEYPFGLGGSPVSEAMLGRALQKPVVVLLGTADTDPDHPNLPDQPAAQAQGPHRLARGQSFYAAAKAKAAELEVPFGWRIEYAEGIGHSNGEMAVVAAPLLAN